VRAAAPGLTGEKLRELADDAGKNCPLSKALEGNVAISVHSSLA
jgi:organic hydroperoxide reductase OsmC/OhrA